MNGKKRIKFYHNRSSVACAITPAGDGAGFMRSYSIGNCGIGTVELLEVFIVLLQTAAVLFESDGYSVIVEPSFKEWFEDGMRSVYGSERQKPWVWDKQ